MADTKKVKTKSADSSPGFLEDKVIAGDNITITTVDSGTSSVLKITAADQVTSIAASSDEKAAISSTDSTPSYLEDKLIAGTNVTITKVDSGTNEVLRIEAGDSLITDHTELTTIGTNTHAEIDTHITSSDSNWSLSVSERQDLRNAADGYASESTEDTRWLQSTTERQDLRDAADGYATHIADATLHFVEGSIDHTAITNIGNKNHTQIDSHIANEEIHIGDGTTSHTVFDDIGTNTHAEIDTHITNGDASISLAVSERQDLRDAADGYGTHVADATLHFTEGSIDHTAITNIGVNTHVQLDSHVADATLHFVEGSIDHTAISNIGVNTHVQLDSHVADATLHFTEASIDHTAISNIGNNSHAQLDSDKLLSTSERQNLRDAADAYGTHVADSTLHFTEASIDHTAIANIGMHTHANLDTFQTEYDGCIVETIDIDVDASGATIELTLQGSGATDITIATPSGLITLDCTPALSVTLTAGTATSPVLNYVYVLAGTTLTASTTGWPSAFHAPIATVLVLTRALTNSNGALKVHAYTDHLSNGNSGHLVHVGKRIRVQPAIWTAGTAITTVPALSASGATMSVSISTGNVFQMHPHATPALDGSVDGHTIVNDSTTAYTNVTDLSTILTDAAGGSLTGKHYSMVIWGVASEKDADTQIMVNLPSGSYNNQTAAERDADRYTIYTIPTDFVGTGFLIARLTVKNNTDSSWDMNIVEDLRGQFASQSAGGGVGITSHLDLTNIGTNTHDQIDTHITSSDSNWSLSVSERQDLRDAADGYLSIDGSKAVTGALEISPGILSAPGLNLGDLSTGFYSIATDHIQVAVAGAEMLRINASGLRVGGGRIALINRTATATVPNILPVVGDDNTGIGSAGADALSLIAGGLEGIRITETGGSISVVNINGPLQLSSHVIQSRGAVSADTDSTTTHQTIIGVTDTSSARVVTLQTADLSSGRMIIIKDESGAAGTNNITIATQASETIDGAATLVINTNYGISRLYSDGTNWFVI